MNFVKLVVVVFVVSMFFGFANAGICSMSNKTVTLAQLELSLEMSHKDYHLELNNDAPSKEKLAALQLRIAALETKINRFNSLASVNSGRFGILPEVFEMEINAALASEDYDRINELLYNLRQKGCDAVKLESRNLHNLHRQLKFIVVNDNDCCDEVTTAIVAIDGMMNTIRA